MKPLLVDPMPAFEDGGMRFTVHALTAEGDRVAAEVESYTPTAYGTLYNNHYHMMFEFRDGRIAVVKEYGDTAHARDIFGTPRAAEGSAASASTPGLPSTEMVLPVMSAHVGAAQQHDRAADVLLAVPDVAQRDPGAEVRGAVGVDLLPALVRGRRRERHEADHTDAVGAPLRRGDAREVRVASFTAPYTPYPIGSRRKLADVARLMTTPPSFRCS